MDAVRYFRGMGPARRQRTSRFVFAACLLALTVATVLAAIIEFG